MHCPGSTKAMRKTAPEGYYDHVIECLEAARNSRFCAGAEKAAVEIERLSAENKRLNTQIASMNHAAHAYDGAVERLDAENSRLKGVLAELKESWGLVSTGTTSKSQQKRLKIQRGSQNGNEDTQSGQEDTQNGNELVYPRQKRDEINGLEIPECLSCGAMSREECSCV